MSDLWDALEQRVAPEVLAWVREAVAEIEADPAAIRTRFAMACRARRRRCSKIR